MNKPNKPEDFANWAIGIEDASTPLQAIIDHIIDDEAFPGTYDVSTAITYILDNWNPSEQEQLAIYALLGRYAVEQQMWQNYVRLKYVGSLPGLAS